MWKRTHICQNENMFDFSNQQEAVHQCHLIKMDSSMFYGVYCFGLHILMLFIADGFTFKKWLILSFHIINANKQPN